MADSLEAIYADLPEIDCSGRCFESCSFIGVFSAERRHMVRNGVTSPELMDMTCRHLDFAGRCKIHQFRPVICRLYGVTEEMRCPFGCKPERMLTKEEGREIMGRVQALAPDDADDAENAMLARLLVAAARLQ